MSAPLRLKPESASILAAPTAKSRVGGLNGFPAAKTTRRATQTTETATGYALISLENRKGEYHTGLWYFRARYFDSELGRFISRDPIGYVDGMSLYAGYFAMHWLMDPSGLSADDDEEYEDCVNSCLNTMTGGLWGFLTNPVTGMGLTIASLAEANVIAKVTAWSHRVGMARLVPYIGELMANGLPQQVGLRILAGFQGQTALVPAIGNFGTTGFLVGLREA